MRTFFTHLYHVTGWRCKFIFHWTDLHLFIQWSFSHQIFLVYLTYSLSSVQGSYIWPTLSLFPIHIEIFSLNFMIFISLLFTFKSHPLLVDLSLGEDTGFDVYLFFRSWVELYFNCVISLLGIFTGLLISVDVVGVVELVPNLRIKLSWFLDLLGPENPVRHFGEGLFTLHSHEVVIEERSTLLFLNLFATFELLNRNRFVCLYNCTSFLHVLTSNLSLFPLLGLFVLKIPQSLGVKMDPSFSLTLSINFRLVFLSHFGDQQFRINFGLKLFFIFWFGSILIFFSNILLSPIFYLTSNLINLSYILFIQWRIFDQCF